MLERLSKQIVAWQIGKNILQDEDRAVYQYGYELLLNQVINILIAIVIAVIFRAPVPVIVFLLCYIPLRSFCGGYHARTNWGCTVVSAILLCFVCWLTKYYEKNLLSAFYPFAFAVSGYLVYRYAPVQDANKPLDETEIIRYRGKSRMLWAIESVIGIAFYFGKGTPGFVIAVGHIILSVMLCLGVAKNSCDKNKEINKM